MRATFCAIGFIVCIASGVGQTKTPASVTILFKFESAHSQIAVQEMKRELGTLMDPLGFELDWRDRGDTAKADVFEDLVLVDFRGRCSMLAADLPGQGNGALAHTAVSDGKVLPFSEVECDRVRAFLHSAKAGAEGQPPDLALGRALARVLAHELHHVLSQSTAHSDSGLAKPSLSRAELVSQSLEFK
jgi:hypothetical protein